MSKKKTNTIPTKKKKTNTVPPKKTNILTIVIPVLCIVVAAYIFINKGFGTNTSSDDEGIQQNNQGNTTLNEEGDLVIPIKDITSTATFYPVEVEGTNIEVLAVKAPDGTIRTAFNTCQVCYDSGRGYYKQSGDVLICQNCGNQFKMSEVENAKDGCNPVAISSNDKTVDEKNIVISKGFLKESKNMFANWK